MKNFVQVCHHPFPSLGGPAKTIQQFHAAVGARTIGFAGPTDGTPEKAVVTLSPEVRTIGGKLASYYYARAARLHEAEQAIKEADLVLLHGLFTYPPVWAAGVCLRHGVPYAIAPHGYLDPWALKKSRLIKKIWMHRHGDKILRNASAVICATKREAEKVAPLLHSAERIRVISWACEIPDHTEIRQRRNTFRYELGFKPTDRVLVFFGRIHSMKRPLETLRLVAARKADNLKLMVIGPDDDVSRAQLEMEARLLGWKGLRVVGPVFGDRKFKYLALADAYISLSHRENFNYSLAEAMAAGLPPILSPGNDLGWEFAGEQFSWQLQSDGTEELWRALDEFLGVTSEELIRRGEAAREWAGKNLGLGRLREQLMSLGGDEIKMKDELMCSPHAT
jgi:glycosyltransferase involved in cell wall biosynthesis